MKPQWSPSADRVETSSLFKFMKERGHGDYSSLHKWSVENPEEFWTELFVHFDLIYSGDLTPACSDLAFDHYGWFPNVRMNFAENLLAKGADDRIGIRFVHESGADQAYSYGEIKCIVRQLQVPLKKYISEGDVLGAYMPNIPETLYAMLAATSLGGVFTSTSSDFGIEGVVDRFGQSRPKVLVAAAGYEYNGKYFDQLEKIKSLEEKLPFLEKIIIVDFLGKNPSIEGLNKAVLWSEFLGEDGGELEYVERSFSDPLYIMYSSGTTGMPKCIVHGIGGTLLQHVKELSFHTNLKAENSIFYFTTCGWMMWNWLMSSLMLGSEVVLYEGSPGRPSLKEFFEIIDKYKIDYFGTSPKFLKALEDSGYNNDLPLDSLKSILSTGAPLLPEQFDFIYEKIKSDVNISSICGGTDILGCFMLGNPLLPVYRGEIQCLGLGMDIACYDDGGKPLIGAEGELVCRKSFPSRPLHFLNDSDNEKIKKAYFNKYENIWHHGDFVTITENGGVSVFGRSDATLNPGGVRIGTAEIYRQTEQLPFLVDSICVGKQNDGEVDVTLFVILKEGRTLDDDMKKEIKSIIKKNTTPRHVPRYIFEVTGIPYTRSGKKMELAVTRLINGKELTNIEAVANPECLEHYKINFS